MKKKLYLIVGAVSALMALNSCTTNVLDLDKKLAFSTQTVEQQKNTIEQNGIDLATKIEAMQNTKAMVALNAFATNAGGSPVFVKPLVQLRTNIIRNNMTALETFNGQMKVAAATGDGMWGTWTWTFTTKDFDYVAGAANSATIKFPGTENSTTNNGEIKITYAESTVAAPDTDPVQYMPKSFSVVLKVDGTTALTADFSASYNSDATPTKVSQTLTIDKYNWSLTYTNNDKDLSVKYAFNYDTDVLMKFEVAAAGTLTATAIQNVNNSVDGGIQDILSSGAVYYQVMNIAFLGGIKDFKAFYNAGNALPNGDTKAIWQSRADVMNNYIKMYGYFVKEQKKFADIEFYVSEKTYQDYIYNPTTGQYAMGTVTDYNTEPRMVLSDGSKQTMEEFASSGFEDLITKLQSLGGN